MKTDIIIAGVGGQGILSIAAVIGIAALKNDLFIKQSEVHGMSQRGGAVQSHLRISDHEIASDLIPMGEADLILSVEPMESLRYLPFLKKDGWLVTNTAPYVNIPKYPDTSLILKEIREIGNHIAIYADRIAQQVGSPRSSNMVTLGASWHFLKLSENHLKEGIEKVFMNKGRPVVESNIRAFYEGEKAAKNYLSTIN